ncbi:hypothetical protein [Phormidesmis sp. 146-33]
MVNLIRGFVDRDVGSNLVLPKVKGAYRSQVPLQVQMVDLGGKRLLLSLYAPTHHLRKEFPQSLRFTQFEGNVPPLPTWLSSCTMTAVVGKVQGIVFQAESASTLKMPLISHLLNWVFQRGDAIVAFQQFADSLKPIGFIVDRVQVVHNLVVTLERLKRGVEPENQVWFLPGQPLVLIAIKRLWLFVLYSLLERLLLLLTQTMKTIVVTDCS